MILDRDLICDLPIIDTDCHRQLTIKESSGGAGQLKSSEPQKNKHLQSGTIPCFPLHALLVALNRTTVDYFSLDVEGFELDVSKSYIKAIFLQSVLSSRWSYSYM